MRTSSVAVRITGWYDWLIVVHPARSVKNSRNTRLLVVEDEEKVVRFVTLGLKAEQFAVDDARDGRTGREMALKRPYDLLIVDLMLPELSGTELISQLRRHNTAVPIIVLTARDAVDDKVKNFCTAHGGVVKAENHANGAVDSASSCPWPTNKTKQVRSDQDCE